MSNIKLVHHDDKKGKWRSHEVYLKEENFYDEDGEIYDYDLLDVMGYGATKEEALENFKSKLKRLFNKYKELEKQLLETDSLEKNMVEVDCFGKELN